MPHQVGLVEQVQRRRACLERALCGGQGGRMDHLGVVPTQERVNERLEGARGKRIDGLPAEP